MNFSAIKNGFVNYLKQQSQYKNSNIDFNSVSIYAYKDEFSEYLSQQGYDDTSIFNLSQDDIDNLNFETDKDGNTTLSLNSNDEDQQFTIDLLNEILADDTVSSLADASNDGTLDENEITDFLSSVNKNDKDSGNLSLDDLTDVINSIYGKAEVDEIEEEDEEEKTSSIGGSGGSGGGSGGSSGKVNTKTVQPTALEQATSEHNKNIETLNGLAGLGSDTMVDGNGKASATLAGYNLTDEQKNKLTEAANNKNTAQAAKETAKNNLEGVSDEVKEQLTVYDEAVTNQVTAQEEVNDTQLQKESIEEQLTTATNNYDSINTAHQTAENNVSQCEGDVSSAQATVSATPETIEKVVGKDKNGKDIVEQVENPAYEAAQEALQAAQSALESAKAEEQNLKSQLDTAQAEKENLENQKQTIEQTLETATATLEEANKAVEEANEAIDTAEVEKNESAKAYKDAISDYQTKGTEYTNTKQTIMQEVQQAQANSGDKIEEELQKEIDKAQQNTESKMTYADLLRLKNTNGKGDENISEKAKQLWEKYENLVKTDSLMDADGKDDEVMEVINSKFGSENNFLNALAKIKEGETVNINGTEIDALEAITNKEYIKNLDSAECTNLLQLVNSLDVANSFDSGKLDELKNKLMGLSFEDMKNIVANKFGEGNYKFNDGAWCLDFVNYLVSELSGIDDIYDNDKCPWGMISYVPALASYAKENGIGTVFNHNDIKNGTVEVNAGDIVLVYDSSDNSWCHATMALSTDKTDGSVETLERHSTYVDTLDRKSDTYMVIHNEDYIEMMKSTRI